MSSTWQEIFRSALNESVDTSSSIYRVKDFTVLSRDFARPALQWVVEQANVPKDFVAFLRTLAYQVCILPTALPAEAKDLAAFGIQSANVLRVPEIIQQNFNDHRVPPVFFSPEFSAEKLSAVCFLSAVAVGYRGPFFMAAPETNETLGILNAGTPRGPASERGLERNEKLPFISPGLKA